MKKSLFGLAIAVTAFLTGTFAAALLIPKVPPIPAPLFDQELAAAPSAAEIPVEDPEPAADMPDATETDEFFYGWYVIPYSKKMPEVEIIQLSKETESGENGADSGKTVVFAGIFTSLSDDPYAGLAENKWVRIDGDRVSFETKKLKGIVYRFEGRFFKGRKTGPEGEKLLRGTLQKFVKGKKVAETSGEFEYHEPRCLA
ncbi:MAG: hypothetical protein JSS81_05080 [Acidobacteria bacterium]|nr:hypothetical protein [Acidobacteriota bacterium]